MRFFFRRVVVILMTGCLMGSTPDKSHAAEPGAHRIRLVIHGGAGTISREMMTPEVEALYRAGLTGALEAGYAVLKNHGSSLDAVEAAVRVMEDSPLFNAGKGAVFTHDGKNELDASIMDGGTQQAGAVAAVRRIKNPISLARRVMEHSKHVLLAGEGAEAFAAAQGIELIDPQYFFTQRRWDQLQKMLREGQGPTTDTQEGRHGTVGAVALDERGNLAAATSTGGLTNKLFGRVGDSPIIGAGTYADNATCAVSGTGDGEYFIRAVAAFRVSMLVAGGMGVGPAAEAVIGKIGELGGKGGLIVLDKDGNFAMPFSTEGMYRGTVDDQGKPVVMIFKE